MPELDIKFQFGQAGLFNKDYRNLSDRPLSGNIPIVASAFVRNCERVFEMSVMLVNSVFYTEFLTAADRDIKHQLGVDVNDRSVLKSADYIRLLTEKRDELYEHRNIQPGEHWEFIWTHSSAMIEMFIEADIVPKRGALSLLSSMTIVGWMAFESLAIDIWKLMLNEFPTILASNVLNNAQPRGNENAPREQKSISLEILRQNDFDISRKMGDILSNNRRVHLESLNGILSAYRVAFGSVFSEIPIDVENLFIFEAVRNLYAHRGGIVDEIFIRRTRKMNFIYPLMIGQEYVINGAEIGQLMNVMIDSGLNLIAFADDWFKKNTRILQPEPEFDFGRD